MWYDPHGGRCFLQRESYSADCYADLSQVICAIIATVTIALTLRTVRHKNAANHNDHDNHDQLNQREAVLGTWV